MSAMLWQFLAYAVMAIWVVFIVLFLLAHPREVVSELRRAQDWWIGMLLQILGFVLVFVFSRPLGSQIGHVEIPWLLEIALAGSAIAIALLSAWLVIAAVQALGKQFAVAARVISGHDLITSGPFRIVRHPIYTGVLGMLIATAMSFSTWPGLVLSVALYLAGTTMRIRKEERLLRETFGTEFQAYAEEVPALVPGLF